MRAMIASGIEPSAIAGRIRCLIGVPGGGPVARDDPVEDVEVRRVLGVDEDVLAADAREPAELDREGPLQDDREEEDRDRDPDQRDEEARVVDRLPVPLRRDEAERNAEEGREDHRAERELDRRREPLSDLLGDRAAGSDARPEVARSDRLEVPPVLLVDRVVEPVLVSDLRDGLRRRALAEQRLGGRPGESPDPEEDEQREPDEDRDEQEQPADGEAEHCAPTSSSAGPPSFRPFSYPMKRTVANDSSVTGLGL